MAQSERKPVNLVLLTLSPGEVHEDEARSSDGGDGRLLRSRPSHHQPEQQLSLRTEDKCLVSSHLLFSEPQEKVRQVSAPLGMCLSKQSAER